MVLLRGLSKQVIPVVALERAMRWPETMLDEALRSRSRHILESTKGSFHGPSHLDPKIPDGTWLSGLRSCTFLQQQGLFANCQRTTAQVLAADQ